MWNKIVKLNFLVLLIMAAGEVMGQQDAMFTQHMFNKLAINPAYAGSRDMTSMTFLYRDQWSGIEGAPKTGTFSIHSPLKNNRIALGFMVLNDRLGLINETGAWGTYAYRIPMGAGKLSFAIDGGISNYRYDFSESTETDPTDPILFSDVNLWLPNFGFGAYYYSPKWFAGFSLPHLINNKLGDQIGINLTGLPAQEYRHAYAMAGYVFKLSEGLKFRASGLMKYAPNAPIQGDFNGSFLIHDVLWLGAAYRSNASVDFNVEVNITPFMRMGYAYDYPLIQLSGYTSGSHEILLGFDFNFRHDRVLTPRNINPRYF